MKKLTQKQQNFVNEFIRNKGNAAQAAMVAYNVKDYSTASTIGNENINKPAIRQAIDNYNKDLRDEFKKEAANAFETIVTIMNDPKVSGRTRLDAAKDLLDRAGYKPADKQEISGPDGSPIEVENRMAQAIAMRARLLLENTGEVIEG